MKTRRPLFVAFVFFCKIGLSVLLLTGCTKREIAV